MKEEITDEDKADFAILRLAGGESDRFVVPVTLIWDRAAFETFNRGTKREWWRLVDISPISLNGVPTIHKVFQLTQAGLNRRAALKAKGLS